MNKHILIADDDPHIRDVISFALEKAGMQVTQTEDGRQALDTFRHHPADLLVLDINMPELDGLEVCREIRKFSDVPILFLSSRDDEIDRILGLEIGGDDYVTKPFSPRELVARINVILKRTQQQSKSAVEPPLGTVRYGKLVSSPNNTRRSGMAQPLISPPPNLPCCNCLPANRPASSAVTALWAMPTMAMCMSVIAPSTAISAIFARNLRIVAVKM